MKKITYIILFIQLSTYSFATNYYISYNSGNDSNTGLTTSDPKKTISAANTILATFTAGDRMYFEKGSVWKESELIMTSRNGTALSPIQFLSYGTGKDPIITTYKELGTFTSLGGNKYSITDSDLPDNYLNTITYADYEYPSYYNYLGFLKINGVSYGMGKYPSDNNSYLTADDVSEDNVSYLYDAAESGRASGYWNGAQMQVGVGLFTDDLARVTSFSGGQFNFTTSDWAISAGSPALSGHDPSIYRYLKYFLVNHTNCLLDNGDWMYANSSKTITVYWDSDINNDLVEQNVLPHAVYIKDCDYVNVSGIKFEGGYVATTRFESCNNLTINGVDFSNGAYALCLIDASDNVTLTADSFNLSASNGVYINDCYDVYINGIDVDSCGIIHSLGGDRDQYNKQGIQVILNKGRFVLLNSSISNTGASGIAIKEIQSAATQDNSRIIRGNIFENFCATVSDQAGIYSYYGRYPYAGSTKEWCKNILINSTGNPGWVYNGKTISPAIYPDEWENYVRIDSNIVFNVPACYYTHGTDGNSFKYNKAVNFNKASDLTGSGWTQHGSGYIAIPDRNGEIKYNEFVGLDSTDIMATYFHYYAFADNGMDIDYNKYSNIFDVGGNVFEEFSGYSESYHTFSSWKSLVSTWDVNSSYNYNGEVYNTGSGIDRDEWIKFPINDNRLIADTISLHSCVFEDIDGNEISGSVIIQPFDAVVLYYKSGNADSLALVESGTLGYLYDYTPEPTDTTSTSTISDTLAKINFTFEGHNATGWYSMTGGTSGNLDIGNGIFMTSDGLSAGVSGITGGLWDDYVSVSYMYQPNSGINIDSFMFTGINPDYSINIDIGSFRSDETVTENRTTYFWTNLSEDTLSVNSVGNQSILRFDSLNVSSEGSFTLYVMNTEGKYSYINGAIITQNSQTTSLRVNALNIYEKSRVIEHRGLGRMVIIFSDYKDKIGFTGLILNSNYLEMNGPYVICEGDYLDLECNVVDVDSFVLSSNQFTGSFDDDHYKYAIFTPSEADVSLGSGYIVGTVYKNLQVLLDSFLLTINKPPVMYVGNDATLGVGIAYGLGSYGGYWSNAIDSRYKNLNGSVYYYEYGLHDSYTPSVLDLNDTVLIEGLAYAYFGTGCVSARDTMSLFIVDLTNPSAPTNLDTVSTGSSYISVEWTTSTDNVGVTFYRLALNDVVIDSTSNTFYTFNGLSSSTEYELKVNATDSYYNYSNWSDSLLITTKSTGDYSLDTLSIYARYRLENDFTDEYSSSLNGTGIGTDSFSSDSLIEGTYSYGQLSADDRFYTPDLVLGDTFSISMWVNPVVLGGVERRLFSTHNNRTDSGFEAYLTNASGPHYIRTYTGNGSASDLVVSSSGSVLDSVWNHIVITFAKSSATGVIGMYINGINRTNSDPSTLGNFNSDSIIYFGADPDAANDLYAYIDDIQIYKYILNQNDVTSLYSSPGDTILKIVDVEYSPTVVYKASNPNPANGAVSVDKDDNISWTGSDTSYVYVSYDNVIDTADYLIKTTSKSYSLPTLTYGDTVFWKINTSYDGGYLLGYEWYFVVQDYVAPIKASDPSPSNSSIYVGINPTLTWTATDSSFVYFGTDSSPDTTEFVQSNTSNSYSPGTLDYATTYYWKVSVHDGIGWVEGDTWSFRTINEPSSSYVRTFPGAVGYGSSSRAAYGGASDPIILIVDTVSTGNFSTGTNRGTFRWCVAQPYPRIILFEVGGVWDFTGTGTYRIDIDQPYLSIYGQSAPSP
ncbi:hypothetical protein JW865_09480, partial [Candidatus Bathyarchaeota archaeon]|nr:hypothetical protein [Candidatus Bathyarchaeota archaeon]